MIPLLLSAVVLIPFDFDTNQIFVRASVNGGEPSWFILDTGASANVLDAAFAKKLGIKQESERQSSGAGKGTVKAGLARGVRYDVGGTSTVAETTYLIDLSGQPAILGREIAGILGYDFFIKFAVEVDYEAQVLRLHDPATFKPNPRAEPIKVTLEKKVPLVPVQIKVPGQAPVTKQLLVDSGSQDAVDDDVMAQSPIKLEVLGGVGLGQEYRVTVGRGDWAKIGSFTLRAPVGVGGGVALIGNEVLRRFHLGIDYSRKTLWLEPNRHLDDAFATDASGLDLRYTADRKAYEIHDVNRPSPAADAGIKAGDLLLAIDGRPVSELGGIQRIHALLTRTGMTCALTIKRGAETREVPLTLRERF
jgi:hypothetical protein